MIVARCDTYGTENKFVCRHRCSKTPQKYETQKLRTREEARGILIKLRRHEIAFMVQFCGMTLLRLHQINKYKQNVEIESCRYSPTFNHL